MTKSRKDSAQPPLKIEVGKEYLQRNGNRFRVYAVDGGGRYPVHGAFYDILQQEWVLSSKTSDGKAVVGLDSNDLVALAPRMVKVDQRFVLVDKGDGTGALLSPTYVGPFTPGDTYKGGKIIGYRNVVMNVGVVDS